MGVEAPAAVSPHVATRSKGKFAVPPPPPVPFTNPGARIEVFGVVSLLGDPEAGRVSLLFCSGGWEGCVSVPATSGKEPPPPP